MSIRRCLVGLVGALLVLLFALGVAGENQLRGETITMFSDDFESEPVVPPPIPAVPGYIDDYDHFANWDVVGRGVDLVGPYAWDPAVFSNMVDLDGWEGSTLITKQAFGLVPGTQYILTFDLLGPRGGDPDDYVVVQLGSVFNERIRTDGLPLTTFTRTISVNQATTGKLSFSDLGWDANGAYLDNVRLEEVVPEPSTLVGLVGMALVGALGYLWRRRRGR